MTKTQKIIIYFIVGIAVGYIIYTTFIKSSPVAAIVPAAPQIPMSPVLRYVNNPVYAYTDVMPSGSIIPKSRG